MLAKRNDIQAAVALIGVYALLSIVGIPSSVLRSVLTRPIVSRGLWMLSILFVLVQRYYLTAVLLIVIGMHVSFSTFSSFVYSSEGILAQYAEAQKNDPRFAADDLDIKMAEGTLQPDPARWQDPGRSMVPLLLFPPTPAQLSLISNNGH